MPRRKLNKTERFLRALLVVVAVLSLAGVGIVFITTTTTEGALFELITFIISITAVTLAILSSINSIQQTRAISRIAREVHGSIATLDDIDKTNASIKRRVAKDYKLGQDIAEALAEAGLLPDENERHTVAKKIEQKIVSKRKSRK